MGEWNWTALAAVGTCLATGTLAVVAYIQIQRADREREDRRHGFQAQLYALAFALKRSLDSCSDLCAVAEGNDDFANTRINTLRDWLPTVHQQTRDLIPLATGAGVFVEEAWAAFRLVSDFSLEIHAVDPPGINGPVHRLQQARIRLGHAEKQVERIVAAAPTAAQPKWRSPDR